MLVDIKRFRTKSEAAKAAQHKLNELFDAYSHLPTLFLSSGGSSLELLEGIVMFPRNATIGMTDERFFENPKINNFAKLTETLFFEKAQDRGAYFIDTRMLPREDMEIFSRRYEDSLQTWKKEHPGGRIVITQGVGQDGHTLGIMPYPKEQSVFQELFEGENWVVGYDAANRNEYSLRVTITLPFLRMVDHSVLYITGTEKKDALSRMLSIKGTLSETPARIIHEMKDVTVYTDIQSS